MLPLTSRPPLAALLIVAASVAAAEQPGRGEADGQANRPAVNMTRDAQPWFPLGVIGVPAEHFGDLRRAGFDLTMRWKGDTTRRRYDRGQSFDSGHNRATVLPYLDAAHAAGLKVIEAPIKLVEESLYVKFRDADWRDKYPIISHQIVPGIVRLTRDHPAVVGYYSYDEPDDFYPEQPEHPKHLLMRRGVEEFRQVVHQLDPHRPVMTLFAVDLQKVRDWDAWDVALRDFYIGVDQPMTRVCDVARAVGGGC